LRHPAVISAEHPAQALLDACSTRNPTTISPILTLSVLAPEVSSTA
jgi:hypothetical protein